MPNCYCLPLYCNDPFLNKNSSIDTINAARENPFYLKDSFYFNKTEGVIRCRLGVYQKKKEVSSKPDIAAQKNIYVTERITLDLLIKINRKLRKLNNQTNVHENDRAIITAFEDINKALISSNNTSNLDLIERFYKDLETYTTPADQRSEGSVAITAESLQKEYQDILSSLNSNQQPTEKDPESSKNFNEQPSEKEQKNIISDEKESTKDLSQSHCKKMKETFSLVTSCIKEKTEKVIGIFKKR
jgi:hypothetical protein